MACITPPALTDEQLLALIDGAATDDVVAHVQQCADCRSRANALAHRQGQLAIQFYRVACPSPLELGEYHLDLLPAERRLAVAEHLTTCADCEQEIQALQDYLLDLAPTLASAPTSEPVRESLGQRWQSLVATVVDTLSGAATGGGRMPALAGMRGEPEEQLVYGVDDLQIIIAMPPEPKQSRRKGILGLILGLEAGEQFEAQLYQSDAILMTTIVDEGDNFVFEHLMPGLYTLVLRGADREIRIENLNV